MRYIVTSFLRVEKNWWLVWSPAYKVVRGELGEWGSLRSIVRRWPAGVKRLILILTSNFMSWCPPNIFIMSQPLEFYVTILYTNVINDRPLNIEKQHFTQLVWFHVKYLPIARKNLMAVFDFGFYQQNLLFWKMTCADKI